METFDQLNGYSSEDFRKWLEERIRAKYDSDPKTRYYACDFRSLGVSFGESHIDDLQRLFKKLEPNSQTAFREGVRLLSTAQPDGFPKDGKRDLELLAVLIQV